jgi:hypothetical protein
MCITSLFEKALHRSGTAMPHEVATKITREQDRSEDPIPIYLSILSACIPK